MRRLTPLLLPPPLPIPLSNPKVRARPSRELCHSSATPRRPWLWGSGRADGRARRGPVKWTRAREKRRSNLSLLQHPPRPPHGWGLALVHPPPSLIHRLLVRLCAVSGAGVAGRCACGPPIGWGRGVAVADTPRPLGTCARTLHAAAPPRAIGGLARPDRPLVGAPRTLHANAWVGGRPDLRGKARRGGVPRSPERERGRVSCRGA